ncbi:MAG TPA: glycosyltransferase family 4 protein [Candidatus Paceibacterota bacterium]|jgi:Glycosyltransferase
MRLLIATGIFPPQIGGPATYSKLLYDELPKRGWDVEVANFGDYLDRPKIIRHVLYFMEVLKKAQTADVVYAQDPVSAGLPALLAAQVCRKKFFIRVAGDYAWEQATQRFGVTDSIDDFQKKNYGKKVEFFRGVQKFVVDGARVVITPSVYFQKLVAGWCEQPEKVVPIYNGIEDFGLLPTKVGARALFGFGAKEKVIVTSGRLVPWKGFEALIRIIAQWKAEGRLASLVIVGSGPDKAKLEALAAELDIKEQVRFVGTAARETMVQYLVAADVYALNTAFESFSFAVVEAMRSGLPVISTAVGSIPELVENGVEGLLVPFNDQAQLKFSLECVLSDASLRRDLGKNGKKKSMKFSIDATLDQLVQLLRA